jgi:hypothetical protein
LSQSSIYKLTPSPHITPRSQEIKEHVVMLDESRLTSLTKLINLPVSMVVGVIVIEVVVERMAEQEGEGRLKRISLMVNYRWEGESFQGWEQRGRIELHLSLQQDTTLHRIE